MAPVALGDESLPNDPVPFLSKPSAVRSGVMVAPPHRGVRPEPAGGPSFVPRGADDAEEPLAGHQPACHLVEHGPVPFARHVDEGIESDHRREAARREIHVGKVGAQEPGFGHQSAGSADLHIGDVHTGDVKPMGERPCGRDPRAAPEVEDRRSAG